MMDNPTTLAGWIALFSQAELPVLKSSARALERLRSDESALNARAVAGVVTDDPLMTVKLLRYMQQRKRAHQQVELIDVKQTLLMMGMDTFFRDVPAQPNVEDLLHGHMDALVHLLRTVRRAQRSAHYAFDWALRLHDLHAEEVQASALLTHSAEMLMWCFNPGPMLEIHRRQQADPALRSAEVQKQVLGFTGAELQRQLAVEWRLPALLLDLFDPAEARSTRVRNVMLAVSLARHSATGWDDAALPDDYLAIAELLRMEPDRVRALVMHAADTP
ncbi:MAG: metal-dependent hydrolase [Hydrogenophilales bacterium 16-64-46]|nr:MAG: metal-dependent hydrolase [Hydrogenophilales bacterium 12-64-13]OYZ05514.1 MAG: metal-dependent hydrolase [Hydrogenophilales bacterium 16-64-46]OZA40094.1 MAG: metal-dependent hydrolase [Hydrogenophilales bacterium 17-64-34]HQT00356.1 HDOD domain-containing protein [Thiobacillus sp.]